MKDPISEKLKSISISIFSVMANLANKYNAINLSQGFPDFPMPDFIKEAAYKAIKEDKNQYAPSIGIPELRTGLNTKYKQFYNLDFDPDKEITVMTGATESITAILLGLHNPGDEIIIFEPFYDAYLAVCRFNGIIPKIIPLEYPNFTINKSLLEKAFSSKTKSILINTPNNPTTRVFNKNELKLIGDLATEHDIFIITDEVYEHITYDGHKHLPIASLGYRDRVITISSFAKTFGVTGWKIGYALASETVTNSIRLAHQFITFCSATPLQYALAEALKTDKSFYSNLQREYDERRKILNRGLTEVGFETFPSEGTYYIVANIDNFGFDDDVKFCEFLIKEIGVAAIPMSEFYSKENKRRNLIRFCFCKKIENLESASQRLQKLKDYEI
ncbi:MAG: aminotransferase class I/II-fold pyridoxal phosphate-dependent enzyme [Candidatus Helarchaeota archaeon]